MTPDAVKPPEPCIPHEEACRMHQDATDALAFIEGAMKAATVRGYVNPELAAKLTRTKRKLSALKRKWSL